MEILTEQQHRALAFISAANSGGYSPTSDELDRWLSRPTSNNGAGKLMDMLGVRAVNALMNPYGTAEPVADHLSYVGWVAGYPGLRLTALGKALLRATEKEQESGPSVVILDNNDPLAYIQLLGMLSDVRGALLVDPYLDANELLDLMEFTGVERILVGDKDKAKRTRLTALMSKTADPSVELRACGGLHDRSIIAGDGRVWTIGASLNTVSKRKSPTMLVPMPSEAAQAWKAAMEAQWTTASPLVVPALETGSSTEETTTGVTSE